MEIQGNIVQVMPVESGEGRNGTWKKRQFVIETSGEYPKKVCFTVWGDRAEGFNSQEGDAVTVSFDIESREYNGRWYTDAKAWKIAASGSNVGTSPGPDAGIMPEQAPPPTVADQLPTGGQTAEVDDDDLPF